MNPDFKRTSSDMKWVGELVLLFMMIWAGSGCGEVEGEEFGETLDPEAGEMRSYDEPGTANNLTPDFEEMDSGTESVVEEQNPDGSEPEVGAIACSEVAIHHQGIEVCLDDLTATAYDSDWCSMNTVIEEYLNAENASITQCIDFDQDCYYQCDGWILPAIWEDPDDQRFFITGLERASLFDDQPPRPDEMDVCVDGGGVRQGCCHLPDPDDGATLCHLSLLGEEAGEIERLAECQGGGMMWVNRVLDGTRHLFFMGLALRSLNLQTAQSITLSEPHPISSLACVYQEGDFKAIYALETEQGAELRYFTRDLRGSYVTSSLYQEGERPPLDDGALWEVRRLTVDEQGLFYWELFSRNSAGEERCFEDFSLDYLRSSGFVEMDNCRRSRILSCSDCSRDDSIVLKAATLDFNGTLSLQENREAIGEDQQTVELQGSLGLFSEMLHSSRLIALNEVRFDAPLATPIGATLLLWNTDTLSQPFVLEPRRWGYQSLTVLSVTGHQVLIQLTDPLNTPLQQIEWGIFDLYSDRLHIVDLEHFSDYLPPMTTPMVKRPTQSGAWLFWEVRNDVDQLENVVLLKRTP